MHVLTPTAPAPTRFRGHRHRFVRTDGTIPPLSEDLVSEPILDGIIFCPGAICADQLLRLDRPRGHRPEYVCPQCGYRIDAVVADRRVWRQLRVEGFVPVFFSTDPHTRRLLLQRLARTIHITT